MQEQDPVNLEAEVTVSEWITTLDYAESEGDRWFPWSAGEDELASLLRSAIERLPQEAPDVALRFYGYLAEVPERRPWLVPGLRHLLTVDREAVLGLWAVMLSDATDSTIRQHALSELGASHYEDPHGVRGVELFRFSPGCGKSETA